MSEHLDHRRKRVLLRAQRCGMHENDVLVGRFAKVHIHELDDAQVARLDELLAQNDIDLMNWIIGKTPVPPAFDHDVMAMIRRFNDTL